MNCGICHQPMDEDPMFAFYDRRTMGYPSDAISTICVAAHWDCGRDTWYCFALHAVIRDGHQDWENHLATKTWFGVHQARAFEVVVREAIQAYADRKGDALARGGPVEGARYVDRRTRARVMERDGFRCRRCGAGPRERRLEVDHIYAVTKGGGADDDNLQTLCHVCNSGKRNHPPTAHDVLPEAFTRDPNRLRTVYD